MKKDLIGKKVIITGANSGIGLEATVALIDRGAYVVMAVRNVEKGKAAMEQLDKDFVEVMQLDLADLDSIKNFATNYMNHHETLDILINNAGVMVPPYQKTKDGFELQFGSNHLGHFALTGLLLPVLKKSENSRIVTLSSIAHRDGKIYLDNLDGAKSYKPMNFYRQSKLANLLFAKELDDRLKSHQLPIQSIACHPGISATNLFKMGKTDTPAFLRKLLELIFQSAEKGALPTIFAATNEQLQGGEYIGPDGLWNMKGNPTIEVPAKKVYNKEMMIKLWDVSEKLTGISFDFSIK